MNSSILIQIEKEMLSDAKIEHIARVAHETNRAYCEAIGDFAQRPWKEAEGWQRQSAIDGVRFRLRSMLTGTIPPASAQHEAWMADKLAAGWKHGPVKDAAKREHPCLVQYTELPFEQRIKDYLFCNVVDAFFDGAVAEVWEIWKRRG